MPAAIPLAIALGTAGGGAAAGYFQGRGATKGAKIQSDAATRAAEIQAKSETEALAFTKQQAENEYKNQELARRANYDQWVSQQQRYGTIGNLLGMGPRDIPNYVPSDDPQFNGPGGTSRTGGSSAPSGAGPAVDASKGDIAGQISAYFQSRGVADTETPYWVSKWPELVARGQEIGNPNYANERLAAADILGRRSPTGPPPATGTLGAMVNPYQVASPTPALKPGPYGTLRRMVA
jgi:hypothetical protein